jgi:hypothetical protein
MFIRNLMISLCILTSFPAVAEIEKIAIPGEKGICFYWWPKLLPLPGWQQDRGYSLENSVNALAPVGETFSNAETVMYANAIFKPRIPDLKSLKMLIESDKSDFLKNFPGVVIQDAPTLFSADGRGLISLTYTPTTTGNWERVSYLEEKEYYLIFTISSRTKMGFEESMKAYEMLIFQYSENP